MFLCIDPGSKYIGFTLIDNFKIKNKWLIDVGKSDVIQNLKEILDENTSIHTVLIETGEAVIRNYESDLINLFISRKVHFITYPAKPVRKKLKLERHPSSLARKAKEDLITRIFPDLSLKDISIHELDSSLLYIYHHRTTKRFVEPISPIITPWKRDA